MTVLPLSEVKARLSELADEVHRTHERLEVTRNGREYVKRNYRWDVILQKYDRLMAALKR